MTEEEGAPEEGEARPARPAPKPRLAPKKNLEGFVAALVEMRQRAEMADGTPAGCSWVLLRPEDHEWIEDLATELETLRLSRLAQRSRGR